MSRKRSALVPRAFGEFVVILVGVLAALAVDEWRQGIQDRGLGREYVERLVADLRATSQALDQGRSQTAYRAQAGEWVLGQINGSDPGPVETLMIGALRASYLPSSSTIILGSRGTYDELLSTGNLSTIRSSELRTALARYYDEWTVVGGRLVNGQDRIYYDWYRGSLSPAVLSALVEACRGVPRGAFDECEADLSDVDVDHFASRLASDEELVVAALNRTVQYHQRLLPLFESLADHTATLLEQLEASGAN